MGITVTLDAAGGLEVVRTIDPRLCVPIHYDDYDAFKSPIEDFIAAVTEAGLEDRVAVLERGESIALVEADAVAGEASFAN